MTVTWPLVRPTTSVPLCQGGGAGKCNVPGDSFINRQKSQHAVNWPNRSTDASRHITVVDDVVSSSTTMSGRRPVESTPVKDVEISRSQLDFYYDADNALMARMSVIVRHLGLAISAGACALAVIVVVVVTTIVCRYRSASRASTVATNNGYRRAATDDKTAVDDDGRTRNGYKQRRWTEPPTGGASLIRCDGDGDAFVTSSFTSSRRGGGHVTEWFV